MAVNNVPYRRQLASAAREGLLERLGGRWGGLTLFGPLVFGGLVGLVLAGHDRVSADGVLAALVAGVIGVVIWIVFVVVWSVLWAPLRMHRRVAVERASDSELAEAGLRAVTRDRDLTRHERDLAREELAALARPAEVVRSLTDMVVRGEALAGRIHGLHIETSEKVWAAIDTAASDYLAECQEMINREWPKLSLTLRDRLAAPKEHDRYPQMLMREVWVGRDDGSRDGPFLVGRGDDYQEHIARAIVTLREAIDALG